jgi:putative acyl-CoA dehydrogenase
VLDAEVAALRKLVAEKDGDVEVRARRLVERMGMALQGACLVRAGNVAIADAFCESRIGRGQGVAFGTLAPSAPMAVLIERAWAG